MKIGLLTFHDAINYGAVLQAYALQEKITELSGERCLLIPHYNKLFKKQYKALSLAMLKHPKSFLWKLKYAYSAQKRNMEFFEFARDKFTFGEKNMSYDIVFVGSDQVWNLECTGNDFAYFLPEKGEYTKASYAASFGKDYVEEENKTVMAEFLKTFDFLSVREESGSRIIDDLIGRCSYVSIDPTMLLDAQSWRSIENEYKLPFEKYHLVIIMGGGGPSMIEFALKTKNDEEGVVVINITDPNYSDVLNVRDASPSQWLYLIDHANSVITNSFHGCVFSILFHKSFCFELTKTKKSNTRLNYLLETFDLTDRNIDYFQDGNRADKIDYGHVDGIIKEKREECEKYISTVLTTPNRKDSNE